MGVVIWKGDLPSSKGVAGVPTAERLVTDRQDVRLQMTGTVKGVAHFRPETTELALRKLVGRVKARAGTDTPASTPTRPIALIRIFCWIYSSLVEG